MFAILSFLKKIPWGRITLSLVVILLFIPSNEATIRLFFSFFKPWYEGEALDRSFRKDIEMEDAVAALVILEQYELWEKKAVVYEKKELETLSVISRLPSSIPIRLATF